MPSQQDFGSHNGVPGAWLDESHREDSTHPSTIAATAGAIAKMTLTELETAVSKVDEERRRRQAARER
jgi:hypothetical protein